MKLLPLKIILACASLLLFYQANGAGLEIVLPEPQWILEPVGAPLSQREALLEPRERSLTEELWPLLNAGEYQQAIDIFEERRVPETDEAYSFQSAALNHIIGQIYARLEQNEKAEEFYRVALNQLPDFVRAHQSLGLLYLKNERYPEARKFLGRAFELGGVNAYLLRYLGYLNQQTNNPWGAAAAYEQALIIEYDSSQSQLGLLHALIESGQYSSAQAFVEKLISENENESALWLYRAQIALQLQEKEKAMTSLEIAIRLGDTTLRNFLTCAQLHLEVGSLSRAVELFKASIVEGLGFAQINQIMNWLIQQEQWAYAESLLDDFKQGQVELNDQERSLLLLHEANFAINDNAHELAQDVLQQSILLDPGNAETILKLANLSANDGLYVQAELLFGRAGAYGEVKERALTGHARMAIEQLDYPTALRLLREIIQLNPERFDVMENIRILENLVSASQAP